MTDIAEGQINDKLLKKIAPDVVSSHGQAKLMAKRTTAEKIKDIMDKALAIAANAIGGTFSSRVKDQDTATRKIGQKRLEGREDYDIDSLNDILGLRIIVNSPKDYPKAEEQIQQMEKAGLFKIKKKEQVHRGTYHAIHHDAVAYNGVPIEAQIHSKQSEAESLSNHRIRSEWGEKPEGIIKALRNKQADIIKDLHPDRAKALTNAIALITKQTGDMPDHITTAKLVKQASS